MKGLRFLDFDLTFQRTANGYRAQVLGSPAGQASVEFVLPFKELEIENFLLRFGRPRQPVRRLASSQLGEARAFGSRLFEAAFSGEVRSCLRSSLDEAQRQDLGLRIRLRLTDTPELNDLPWEFLLYPSRDRFLALSAETPLVRYLELSERIRPLEVKPPLKVLTVISSPLDYPSLDVESERRKLQESLAELQEGNLLVLSHLENPTLPDLQRWLRRETCHIFHFIGHGGFNSKTEDGLLLFTDENGRGREVTGQTLGTLLHDHRPLRLAVLNACEGARTSPADPFAGVAQSLVQQGIPAVVAMQFEITDRAAITFSQELYAAVVDGYPVDAALSEARKALFVAGHELEWGTPVLYMRSPDGRIFDVEPSAAPAIMIKAREEPTAVKPVPIEPRPALVEGRPAPAVPKTLSYEVAAKAPSVELALSATLGTVKEEPMAVRPAPIESRPAPSEVKPVLSAPKALSSEAIAGIPIAPSVETSPPSVTKPEPTSPRIPSVQHTPPEAKTARALPRFASHDQGRRHPPHSPATSDRVGSSLLTAYAIVMLIGILAAIFRHLTSLYFITIIGFDQKFPAIVIFGRSILASKYIAMVVSMVVFPLGAVVGAEFYSSRYRPRSEALSNLATLIVAVSFFVTMLVTRHQIEAWWVREFAPFP